MKLRHKIILFAVMPLVLALCAIALTVRHHAISLAQQEQEVIKPAYLASKEAELKNYVALATHAIAHLYKSGRTDAVAKNEAKAILEKLEYGDDGYFFVYDLQGTMLIHPRQQGWVGKNMWDFKDATGKLILIEKTNQSKTRIDLSSYSNGLYFLQFQSDEKLISKKIIKQ